jgi:hypothetical protein
MIKTIHHKINILPSDFKKITAFGEILHLSSRLNLDDRNRHARSVHWLPIDVQRTPCHCHSDGMNQLGSQQLNQGIAHLPAYCGFAFPISLANLDWEYPIIKNADIWYLCSLVSCV